MILPNDILIRETSDGPTVWVSQRMVVERCGVSEKDLRTAYRLRYKSSLPSSWRKVADRSEFFLGSVPGKSWRWGRKNGQYYYDIDTIPNRKPCCYRDRLPSKEELIARVDENRLRGSRERQAELRRMILERVRMMEESSDLRYYEGYMLGDIHLFNADKARQLTEAAAWCRFLREALAGGYKELGLMRQKDLYGICAEILAPLDLEGLRVTTAAYLRKKISDMPADDTSLRDWLVSGKYGNNNRQIIGKYTLVDYATGEVMEVDAHEAIIMTYWLSPGGSTKETKQTLWQLYAGDMEAAGIRPVRPSTFNHYTNKWIKQLHAAKERHGRKYFDANYKPYTPARQLEYANSLWCSDGSGIVPYRYTDQYGKWRMMKLYVMMVSDVASRYIAGYAVSRRGDHYENLAMLQRAIRMAVRDNGRTEVLDFISDNHGAYTSAESKTFLQRCFRNFRTIRPGNSQANPAEAIFRLFKRRFKTLFNLPETSWDARSLESLANPDRYDLMSLPTYDEAVVLLERAVREWNTTRMTCNLTPEEWFRNAKNPRCELYDDRQYRLITGNVSKKDISHARSVLQLVRGEDKYRFEIPSDADTLAKIAKQIGYAPSLETVVYWDAEAADVYTTAGVYLFTCPSALLAAKSMSEATHDTLSALGHWQNKADEVEKYIDTNTDNVIAARDVMVRNYGCYAGGSGTKEAYNAMREEVSAEDAARNLARLQAARRRKEDKAVRKEAEKASQAHVAYCKEHISNTNQYLK